MTKPFSTREISFRIKAQLHRQQYQSMPTDNRAVTLGKVTIDIEEGILQENYQVVNNKEWQLLEH